MMTEPPRPYYDSEAVRRKHEARAALMERVKRALGFGKAEIVPARHDAVYRSSASKVIIDQ